MSPRGEGSHHWENRMSKIRFTVAHDGVTYEGEASSPQEALEHVQLLTGKTAPVVPAECPKPPKVPGVFTEGDRVVFNQNYTEWARKGDKGTVKEVVEDDQETLVAVLLDYNGHISITFAHRLSHLEA